MSIRDAFDKALIKLRLKSELLDKKKSSSSSSSSSSKRMVPRYPEKQSEVKILYLNDLNDEKDDDVEKAFDKVFKDLNALSHEEFMAELEKNIEPVVIAKKEPTEPVELVREDGCDPETCWGECKGKGDCDIAEEWQDKIHPKPIIRKATLRKQMIKNKRKNKNKRKRKKKR
jgi:hypothetical protein